MTPERDARDGVPQTLEIQKLLLKSFGVRAMSGRPYDCSFVENDAFKHRRLLRRMIDLKTLR